MCSCCILATKLNNPPFMNVVLDPGLSLHYCFFGNHCNTKPSRRLPLFFWISPKSFNLSELFEPLKNKSVGDTVSCLTVRKFIWSCKCGTAKVLGLCAKLPFIYQRFCKQVRPHSHKADIIGSDETAHSHDSNSEASKFF